MTGVCEEMDRLAQRETESRDDVKQIERKMRLCMSESWVVAEA